MAVSINGNRYWEWEGTYFGSNTANGARLYRSGGTNTVPTLIPDASDTNTGVGQGDVDELSLIAGGVEGLRIDYNELEVQPKMTLATGPIEFEEDSGAVTAMNMPVSSDSDDGDEMSMSFSVDSNPVLKVKASADGTGGVDELQEVHYGGHIRNTTTVNAATYDLLAGDDILLVTYTTTGAVTSLTLPSAQVVAGRTIVIKDAGGNANTNNITIDTEGSETIDGSATLVINGDYESATLISDGSGWFII